MIVPIALIAITCVVSWASDCSGSLVWACGMRTRWVTTMSSAIMA